ncbi:MAG: AraC family ligand binding domain-containing protein [Myxococcota bacterium]
MSAAPSRFVDASSQPDTPRPFWQPIVIRRAEIQAEAERLASLPWPSSGHRESLVVHPRSEPPALGLAPGIQVKLTVLRPGERSRVRRHNATEIGFCIEGGGRALVGGRSIRFERYDVWNQPSWTSCVRVNDTSELQVCLSYSNAALLERLNVHRIDEDPAPPAAEAGADAGNAKGSGPEAPEPAPAEERPEASPYGAFALDERGAWLLPYEILINPPFVESPALHWPWARVQRELDRLTRLGERYRGRRLYLLYNPMTGRTNGTTPSFFATMTVRPPGIVDRPHRHVSAAINYYFSGSGWSRVDGKRYTWEAGDLMLSAPGWAVHHHASNPGHPVYELTVQDQPFHIAIESLLWQEDLSAEPVLLGARPGFATNRDEAAE